MVARPKSDPQRRRRAGCTQHDTDAMLRHMTRVDYDFFAGTWYFTQARTERVVTD